MGLLEYPKLGTLSSEPGRNRIFDGCEWKDLGTTYTVEIDAKGWTSVHNADGRLALEFQGEPMELDGYVPGENGPAFITKDSGQRAQFDSGMVRDTDKGKPRFDLLVPEGVPYEAQLLTRFAALMARGAEKYDARNWEQANSVEELERMKSSAFRHFMQWICGEQDEDHAAAVLFNIMAAEATAHKMGQKKPEYVIEVDGKPVHRFVDGGE